MSVIRRIPRRVYVVEDFTVLRELILDLIHRTEGLEAVGATDSAESALEDLSRVDPDLMLIDVSLPGMSGLELLAEVRRIRPGIQCVMVSGHRSAVYAARAREAGASAYVVKSDLYRLTAILHDVKERPSSFLAYGLGAGEVE